MKIAFVSSEIAPFASSGGLAEVAGALPKALQQSGVDVVRIMPLHRVAREGGFDLRDTGLRLKVPVGFRSYTAEIWECKDPSPRTFFIRRDEFFDRSFLYNLPERDYEDNFERFLFFQKAAVQLIDALDLKADIVHANDWQTGLMPAFLEHGSDGRSRLRRERTVFTIHNLAFQGVYPGSDYSLTNLPFSEFSLEALEYYGNINCLKAGIKRADAVTTVSRTYSEEIQREEWGCGLHGVLQSVRGKLTGILNGIDTDIWNPATDNRIAATFSADNLAGKDACRADLAERFGVRVPTGAPFIGMVTRLTADKGFDLLVEQIPSILNDHPVSLVLLGQGTESYVNACQSWMRRWPGRISFRNAFDRELSHKVFAGSDLLLMPSKVEPCGLAQMYAMRYGSIPVAHATGGLKDTVESIHLGNAGTGYLFDRHTGEDFRATLDRAISQFSNRALWTGLMRRAMAKDFSWQRSASAYIQIYERLIASIRRG